MRRTIRAPAAETRQCRVRGNCDKIVHFLDSPLCVARVNTSRLVVPAPPPPPPRTFDHGIEDLAPPMLVVLTMAPAQDDLGLRVLLYCARRQTL